MNMNALWQTVLQNQYAIIGSIVVALVGIIIYQIYQKRVKGDYENKDGDAIIKQTIKEEAEELGIDTDFDFFKGSHNKVGKSYSMYEKSMPSEFVVGPTGDDDEEVEEIPDEDMKDVTIILTRPDGKMGKFKHWLKDDVLGGTSTTSMFVCLTEDIRDEHGRISVPQNVDFTTVAPGLFVREDTAARNVVNQITAEEAEREHRNGIVNFTSKVLHYDRNHGHSMGMMEKEAEVEREKNQGVIRNK